MLICVTVGARFPRPSESSASNQKILPDRGGSITLEHMMADWLIVRVKGAESAPLQQLGFS
jgi:hypothetical protein